MKRRKKFTIKELSCYYGVNRNTMRKRLNGVDLRDAVEVLDFIVHYTGVMVVQKPRGNAQSLKRDAPIGSN